ncbi:hypothetical protein Bhyg_01847 [Pseudolycoriella hygida]|uniref:DUF4758 domain-containing protein n=1 Tax=Pseudolycoriella hygida TaxID=35572 RepID=A0A9Q0NAD2_9DIPT|nr:hypothetical protein Bhyg_01847 [Pseudolycoriella hygida]
MFSPILFKRFLIKMMPKLVSSLRLAPLILALILVRQCIAVSGPVYVNPNAPVQVVQVQPTKVNRDPSTFETQTVYGFLDFTTTIGNTIMVFSPNSAPPPEPPKPAKPTIVVNSVIETKPPEQIVVTTEIKPSKAITTSKQPQISSVIQVVASSPEENVIVAKPKQNIPSSKVEIVTENSPSIIRSVTERKEDALLDRINFVQAVPPVISSRIEVQESRPSIVSHVEKPKPVILSSIVEVRSSEEEEDEPVLQVENNIGEPEYDFLSRQPSEFAEETYRVHDIRPSQSKFTQKTRNQQEAKKSAHNKPDSIHPTGLVTKLGGTVVKDGATTVHETSVIGTYISGKYAQVLQRTSHILQNNAKNKISPSSTLRILKTAAPHITKQKQHIEPTSVSLSSIERDNIPIDDLHGNSSPNHVRASRRPAQAGGSFKNRFRSHNNKDYVDFQDVDQQQAPTTVRNTDKKLRNNKPKNNRYNNRFSTSSVELATVSVFSETTTPGYSSRRNKAVQRNNFKPTTTYSQSTQIDNVYTRRFKPKLQATPVDQEQQTSSLYKFKLNRTPGRWQYKTSPKPRVTIRKQNSEDLQVVQSTTPNYESPNENDIPISRSDDIDLDSSSSINGDVLNDEETLDNGIEHRKPPVETLKVEISTPADFKDTYYEIATIKSPYTFQVGSVKNTRYITVTSTFEKTLDPEPTTTSILTGPLTENILATTAHIDKEHNLLDSSIATLPPILLSSDQETPPLETLTETFSTTQLMLKTHILPVLREGGNATSYTLTQTYHITRLVTATKTLPPMEAYQFNPSKALKEFNSKLDEAGSELNLELDFGDDNEHDEEDNERRELPADLDLSNIGSDFDLSEVDKSNIPEGHLRPKKKNNAQKVDTSIEQQQLQLQQPMQNLSPDQLQQLALLRFLNPNAAPQIPQMNQVITTSKPVLKTETVFESHVIPIFNGVSTSFSTISRPVATVTKTEYEIGTSAVPSLPLPPPPINPLFPQQQQQFQITTAPIVTQTMLTHTQSKILKLTFGAKTAYTTIFSTTVVPTILTTFVTQSVAVQPTAAFPGYFPAPFAPFPYVG